MLDTSRNPSDLHPALRERWEHMLKRWDEEHPGLPKPFLTATYRGPIDQLDAFARGTSKAMFGQSLHNYKPAYAFDVAFLAKSGELDWSFHLFEKMAVFGDEVQLEWGGRWPQLVDGPHFQLPMTVDDAKAGRLPFLNELKRLVPVPEPWRLVVMVKGVVKDVLEFVDADDIVVRYSPDRKRIYLDIKREGA
jgi:hypothetical protein